MEGATSEISVRKALHERFRSDRLDPVLRKALFQRAMSFYRTRLNKSGIHETLDGAQCVVVSPDEFAKAMKLNEEKLEGLDPGGKVKADAEAKRKRTLQRKADRELEKQRKLEAKGEPIEKSASREEIVQFYLRKNIAIAQRYAPEQVAKLEAQLEKAEAKGGSYHRRVTDPKSGKHRYFYDPEKYKAAGGHIDGAEAAKDFLHKQIGSKLEKHGECGIEHFKDLAEKHGPDKVADALRDGCGSGKYEFKKGKFRKCSGGTSNAI